MEEFPTFITVVAALIRSSDGLLLLQQGLPGKRHAGLYEFPGGKVDSGETPRGALVREVSEELGLVIEPGALRPAGFAEEAAAEGRSALVLMLYTSLRWSGQPEAREGQTWAWFTPEEAWAAPLAPMDRELLDQVRDGGRSTG
jgi:8-oxo-dGTP diphosphatase